MKLLKQKKLNLKWIEDFTFEVRHTLKLNFLKFSTKTRIIKLIKGLCQYLQLLSLSSLFEKAAVLSA